MAQTALRRGTQEDGNSEYFTGCPIGGGFIWYGLPTKIPVNCRICDNSTLAISQFAKLNENIDGSWGTDGTNVNLPDLRGRFPRGVDNGAGNDPDRLARTGPNTGQNAGDAVGSVQLDAMQGHNHALFRDTTETTFNDTTLRLTADESVGYASQANVYGSWNFTGGSTADPTLAKSSTVGASTESRPKNANVYFVIRVE